MTETGAALASQSTISRLENAPSRTEAGRLSAALLDQFGATVKPGKLEVPARAWYMPLGCTCNCSCRRVPTNILPPSASGANAAAASSIATSSLARDPVSLGENAVDAF
jgi:hypothetical protein